MAAETESGSGVVGIPSGLGAEVGGGDFRSPPVVAVAGLVTWRAILPRGGAAEATDRAWVEAQARAEGVEEIERHVDGLLVEVEELAEVDP